MVEFAYNNSKNANTGHILFELNCSYHLCVSFEDKSNAYSRFSFAKGLAMELGELINVYCQNFLPAQDLQKRAHDKRVKLQSYAPGEKVWLNSKHIKTKRNWKFEAKFSGPFWILHPVGKQAYISWNYQQGGEFTMCSTCYYWSETPQERAGWTSLQKCQSLGLSQMTTKSTS